MKSYLKFLSRNELYTAIEAVGLAVSLAFVILIGTYVVQQYEVAHESPQWKRTFVLGTDSYLGLTYWDKEELEMNIPEVEMATRVGLLWQPFARKGDEPLRCSGMEVDATFFQVFPEYQMIEGRADDFVGKDDVLLSESFARRIAKDGESLIGTTLSIHGSDKTIKGVFADFDGSFFMPCDIITNIEDGGEPGREYRFNNIGEYTTWYRVREDADLAQVNAKVKDLLHKNYDPIWKAENVDKWRSYRMDEAFFAISNNNGLTRQGNGQMLRLLTVVVLLLLLSAVFNYVNLSLALTGKRSKEMATRRLLGADKTGILWKYIAESVAFTAVCFGVALLLGNLMASYSFGRHTEIATGGWNMQRFYVIGESQQFYHDLLNFYFLRPYWYKMLMLPLTMSVQFFIPFPWTYYENPSLINVLARLTYGWYVVGGVALFYFMVISWRKGENMGIWPWWPAMAYAAMACVMAGSVARCVVPIYPLFVPVAMFVLCRLYEGRWRKQFVWWSVCYVVAVTVVLLLCLEIQQATFSKMLHTQSLTNYLKGLPY